MNPLESTATDSNPLPPVHRHRLRFKLLHLMIAIAILAVVLALGIQLIVLQQRAVQLGRWGQSLRDRERYLQQVKDSIKKAVQEPEPRSSNEAPRNDAGEASEPETPSEVPPS